jgi:hypothetical protein
VFDLKVFDFKFILIVSILYICNSKSIVMTTITLNERTKAGKTLLEMAKLLSKTNKGVTIEEGLKKKGLKTTKEERPYNPEFVKMILERDADIKSGKSKCITVDPDDIWGSLGLK